MKYTWTSERKEKFIENHPMKRLENRVKISGEKHPFFGKKCPEHSKWMRENNPMKRPEVKVKLAGENSPTKRIEFRTKMSKRMSGESNPMWGRKRLEITGENSPTKLPEVQAKMRKSWVTERRIKYCERMKNGGSVYASSFIKNPSKPQVMLYEKVRLLYPLAILNYPCKNYSIDIVIPELRIAIEYDGFYWHQHRVESDRKRQEEIEKEGWRFLRYSKLPSDNELRKSLEDLE